MTAFTFSKIAEAGDGLPALESCTLQRDKDTAFVQAVNRFYRWFADSTAVANGSSVVRPLTLSSGNPGRWFRQGAPGPVNDPAKYEIPTDTAFDYIIGSRADVIAITGGPVAGVFELPSGTYAVVRSFSLNADESLRVSGGNVVQFYGYRGAEISGNSSDPLLEVDASTFKGYGFILDQNNTGSVAINLINAASLVLEQCRVLASGASDAIDFNGSSQADLVQTDLIGGPCLGVLSGTARLSDCNLNSIVSGPAVFSQGGILFFEGCNVNSITSSEAVQLLGGEAYFTGNDFFADSATEVISPGGAVVKITGGRISGSGANVGIDVASVESLVVQGVRFETLGTGILCDGGAPEKVVLDSLTMSVSVVGVDWLAANVPTNGLIEIGIVQNSTAAFANHTETDARVNRKACSNGGALLAETPIVP